MQTEFIKLAVIFIVIMVMVLAKLKLRDAMIAAILLTVILRSVPMISGCILSSGLFQKIFFRKTKSLGWKPERSTPS